MSQPLGFRQSNGMVYKLCKDLYGLKQAPRAWFSKLSVCLVEFGFVGEKSNSSLFVKDTFDVYIVVLILLMTLLWSNSCTVNILITNLNFVFTFKVLGTLNYFLCVKVMFQGNNLYLNQNKVVKSKDNGTPMSTTSVRANFMEWLYLVQILTYIEALLGVTILFVNKAWCLFWNQ